ncbi:MAG TPA: hypothetical protein VLI68_09725 [Hanamia sp.]|jgi:hypothetical protein|nr:hypothetical protein [Hanamia sp.]
MKNILFLILFILVGTSAFAVETEGYFITKKGDTIRGKIQVPLIKKITIGASSQFIFDPLKDDLPDESKDIDYTELTFDFKFSENEGKFKKIDRLKVKGFGFIYKERHYDFETWDITANKQIYLIPSTGDVAPDGVYFILRSVDGALPIYSLFQKKEMSKKMDANKSRENETNPSRPFNYKEYDGEATKRDIIFEHPDKGLIYISNQYPLLMKFPAALKYLEFEEEFISGLGKHDNLLDVVKKYNKWKSAH